MVGAGNEALELIASERFDMAIVDLGLEDINPQASVRDIGGANPSIRIMLIPLAGEEVRDERKGVEVQGLLPKAFFVDDLSAIVDQAMAWGGETIPTSAAVSPETHLAARLAETLASEGPSVDSSPTARAGGSPVGDLNIASQDAGRWRSQAKRMTQSLESRNREMRAEAIIVSVGEEIVACRVGWPQESK